MRIDYFGYYPVVKKYGKPHAGASDMRKKLPANIESELIQHKDFNYRLAIRTDKRDAIQYLDKVLGVERKNFSRRHYIEITEDEVENYDYFFMDVRTLDWKNHIDYEVSRPTCKHETCPWGAERTSPTRIYSRKIRSLSLARICDIWSLEVRFVISRELKEIFERAAITGLEYSPCLIEHKVANDGTKVFNDKFYVARIMPSIPQFASDIFIHDYCKKHRVIVCFDICNVTTSSNEILPYDFQMINRVIVKKAEYYYRTLQWFVSRKVLKLLLEHAQRDLREMGAYFKKSFMPVPLTDRVKSNDCNIKNHELETSRIRI